MMLESLLLAGLYAAPALANARVNLYWGQAGNTRLADVCASDKVEYVSMSFVNESPENVGNTNYPGTNFGNHCGGWAYYKVNGESSHLLANCTEIQEDIPKCQAMGTKVLLSIGGQSSDKYDISSVANGVYFADFLWGAFGPYNASWTGPRPFDLDATHHNSVDGFDIDMEKYIDDHTPWIALIETLRAHYKGDPRFLITAAPECPLQDGLFKMKPEIVQTQFDALFIQFYNNAGCDAIGEGFNYDDWTQFLVGTKSAHAKLYIGLLAIADGTGYVKHADIKALVDEYGTRPNFGGIMIWDESYAHSTVDEATGQDYFDAVTKALATVTPTSTVSSFIPTGTPDCANKYTVGAGEYCYAIADKYGLQVAQIMEQNKALDAFCDVTAGQVICLPPTATTTRGPQTSAPACAEYHTVVHGDTCWLLSVAAGISLDEFRALNPSLGPDCILALDRKVCVKGVGSGSSSSGVASVSATATAAPTGIATSTTASATGPVSTDAPVCTKEYTVTDGDYCYKIATEFGIDVADLIAYNPWLDSDCMLMPADVLCVAIAKTTTTTTATVTVTMTSATASSTAAPCGRTYTVVKGDYCYKIATANGLTVEELQALNPELNADCAIDIGQELCVAKAVLTTTTTTTTASLSITASRNSTVTWSRASTLTTLTISASRNSTETAKTKTTKVKTTKTTKAKTSKVTSTTLA